MIDLDKFTKEQIVVSLSVGVSRANDVVLVVFVFSTGNKITLHFPRPTVFTFLKENLGRALQKGRHKNHLDDKTNPQVRRFLAEQPDITEDDWDNQHGKRMVVAVTLTEASNSYAFEMTTHDNNHIDLVLPDQVSLYLWKYILDVPTFQ